MSIRESFVEHFKEEDARAIESAAREHSNGVHDKPGSDHFRWAIAICIGYECMEVDTYRDYHGVTASWPDLKQWIKDHANLADHDGDVDYLSLFAGTYDQFMPSKTEASS